MYYLLFISVCENVVFYGYANDNLLYFSMKMNPPIEGVAAAIFVYWIDFAYKFSLNRRRPCYSSNMATVPFFCFSSVAAVTSSAHTSHDVTKERRPYRCTRLTLWELNPIFIQTFSFVSLNQYGRWSREWKRFIFLEICSSRFTLSFHIMRCNHWTPPCTK